MKVSVILTTYNHEQFITQAIKSILMQKTSFSYEIIIIEDYSQDNTRNIVIDFYQKYPDKIRLVLSEKNLNNNIVWGREILNARGQYIALLDGDNYWTSPHKLQKQVDFLDSHPECSICFHNVSILYEIDNKEAQNYNPDSQKDISTIEDLWTGNFIATCSAMFRSGLIDEFPSWFYEAQWGDWELHILNAQHGKIGYIRDIMGTYRVHSGGLWSKLNEIQKLKDIIKFYENMNSNLEFKHKNSIMSAISKCYYKLAQEYEKAGDLANARTCIIRCFIAYPFNKGINGRELSLAFLRFHMPKIYHFAMRLRKCVSMRDKLYR